MSETTIDDLTIRAPEPTDASDVYDLIGRCSPLDQNSMYCNFLQTFHFRETSTTAIGPDNTVWGFVSGYVLPADPSILFIWQVAVSPKARGLGLGKVMIVNVLEREGNEDIRNIQATIGRKNDASWGMFKSLATDLCTDVSLKLLLDSKEYFDGEQEDEILIDVGPVCRQE